MSRVHAIRGFYRRDSARPAARTSAFHRLRFLSARRVRRGGIVPCPRGRFPGLLPTGAETLYVRLSGVTTSFFRYSYPLLEPTEATPWSIGLASDADIAAMKIEAIAGRGSRKDFVDLRILARSGLSIEAAFEAFDRKYGARRSERYHRLRAPWPTSRTRSRSRCSTCSSPSIGTRRSDSSPPRPNAYSLPVSTDHCGVRVWRHVRSPLPERFGGWR